MAESPNPIETVSRHKLGRLALFAYIVAGLLAFVPAVRTPFFLDDYLHASMTAGTFPGKRTPFQLYDFVDDGSRAPLLARGLLPWWTHPHLTIRFFRPLSSALLWLDHKTFTGNALVMHLHSLVWWAFAVLAARKLFARSFSPRAAFLATLVFALSPCHAMPVAWLANREALVSLTFGILALHPYLRWRDQARPKDFGIAFAFFALALLGGGEYALCFGGYVLAADIVRKQSPVRRVVGWMPFLLPAAAYLGVRARLGYMTSGSGFYSDPIHEPLAFLKNVPWRSAALLADGWLTLDAATWGPVWQKAFVAAIVLAFAVLFRVALRRVVNALEPQAKQTATWLLFGSIFSLAPVLAVVPSLRLMGVAMIGVAALAALVIDHAWFPADGIGGRGRAADLTRVAAIALGFAHFVHGPATTALLSWQYMSDAKALAERGEWLAREVGKGDAASVGVVRGLPSSFFTAFAIDPGGPPPRRWLVLAQAGHVLVLRKDERTIDVIVGPERALYPSGDGNLYRSDDFALKQGDVITVPGLQATILEVGERGPRHVRFVVDDPSALHWVNDARDGMKDIELPKPGFGTPFDP